MDKNSVLYDKITKYICAFLKKIKMIKYKHLILSLAILISLSFNLFSQGHKIDITVKGMADSTLYIAYHYGSKKYVIDTLVADQNGSIKVEGENPLPGGVYLVVLPGMRYFEMLMGDDQEFSVSSGTEDFLNTLSFTGSEENTAFLEYQRFLVKTNKENQELKKEQIKHLSNTDSLFIIQDQLDKNDAKIKDYVKEINKKFPGSFLVNLLNAMTPPERPEITIPGDIENRDSISMIITYGFLRDHYFDNINLADDRLVRTPVLEGKLGQYLNSMLLQVPDSVIPPLDRLINSTRVNDEMYKYVVIFALNNFLESNIMGMDEVFVHVAEKYYLSGEAPWADSIYLEKLYERVLSLRPNLIGRRAPDLKMETITGEWVSLNEVEAPFTVLYFWEPNCGFCKKTTPQLFEIYNKYKEKGLKVFSVDTQGNKEEWEKYVNDNGLDWINAWDPRNQTFFRTFYDVRSTPIVFLLNKDKIIIAKRIDMESLGKMMESLFAE